ncbi:MAG TPA: hypothetical protein VM911_02330 [Pyrinomonadaceae bacterium]|nr:hypothetical protein [Pyrinomonadaceae bacterium]
MKSLVSHLLELRAATVKTGVVRRGRLTSSPSQLGHTCAIAFVQAAQNVHS